MNQKSAKTKQLQGTVQKCRVKTPPSYEPLTSVPDPAFELNDDGMEYFTRFCQILLSNRTMTVAYVPIITRAARFYEIYKRADRKCQETGEVQVTASGYTAKTGHFVVMTDADDRITKIEAMFGMNLAALLKMDLPKTEKKNPLDNL